MRVTTRALPAAHRVSAVAVTAVRSNGDAQVAATGTVAAAPAVAAPAGPVVTVPTLPDGSRHLVVSVSLVSTFSRRSVVQGTVATVGMPRRS